MRRRRVARLLARPPLQQRARSRPPCAGRSSIVPTSVRTMWRMKVSASIQNSSRSLAGVDPLGAHHVPREAHVVGLCGRERGEVVRAQRAPRPSRRASARGRQPQPVPARGRARTGSPPAASRRGSGRCVSGRRAGRRSRRPPARSPARARRRGSTPLRDSAVAGSPSWLATWPRACTPRSVRPATVRTASRAQHGRQRVLERLLHGPQPGLARPARELRAVVLDQEAGAQLYPRLRATISRYSGSSDHAAVVALVVALHRPRRASRRGLLELLRRQHAARGRRRPGRLERLATCGPRSRTPSAAMRALHRHATTRAARAAARAISSIAPVARRRHALGQRRRDTG